MGVPLLDTGTWLATDPRPGLEKTERENHSREGGVLDWDEKERRSKGSVEARVDWQTAGHRTRQAVWGRCLHVSEKGESLYCCLVLSPFLFQGFCFSGESHCVGVRL